MLNRKFLKVTIILVIGFLFSLFWITEIKKLDIDTVISSAVNRKVSVNQLFKSKTGFGNDTFEIYAFEMEEPSELEKSQKVNEDYFDKTGRFKDMINSDAWNGELSDANKEEFLAAISSVEELADSRYLYIEDNKSLKYEVYIYNHILNKGYYMMLKL